MDLNVCAFTGRLGRDPELKYLQSGTAVANFSMAINLSQDNTLWMDVVVWGKQAENVNEFLSKGSAVAVSGRLTQDVWEDEGGNRRTKLKITANSNGVRFLSPKKSDDGKKSATKPPSQAEEEAAEEEPIDVGGTQFPF